MTICTRSLARVPKHARPKGLYVLLEHFRRNRQDFRRGFAWTFRRGRRPVTRELPIVPMDPPVMDGYGSRYSNPRWDMNRPVATCTLDKI
ncbi:hypothetical protein [Streptomyces sp. 1222.5]|uniref:hypothetical protein n=1 Tax=Streptomyces sp. 1222.5 TaxID=1881026 RepID=UPI003EBF0808